MKYLAIKKEKENNLETMDIIICNKEDVEYLKNKEYKIIEIKDNESWLIKISSDWLSSCKLKLGEI